MLNKFSSKLLNNKQLFSFPKRLLLIINDFQESETNKRST